MYKTSVKFIIFSYAFCSQLALAAIESTSLNTILTEIKRLESDNDPKCYATASRLENFMFGTPLTENARFKKNKLQKELAYFIWQKSAQVKTEDNSNYVEISNINVAAVDSAVAAFFKVAKTEQGHWRISFDAEHQLVIHKTDLRQYSSIAYSLRAMLAVQQDQMLADQQLTALTPEALNRATFYMDLYTLTVLKLADNQARLANQHTIAGSELSRIWQSLMPDTSIKKQSVAQTIKLPSKKQKFTLLKQIITQKLASYKNYNEISQQLFFRNLQVYFARVSWPVDADEGKELRGMMTETFIQFASDFYLLSEQIARKSGHGVIEEEDVSKAIQRFVPYEVNSYEDVNFFPKLPTKQSITIESYDIDAFRDSGLHWAYLQYAIEDNKFNALLEPTPFAAELIAENIAQFAVLALRVGGLQAIEDGKNRLSVNYFNQGLQAVQSKITQHISAVDNQKHNNLAIQTAIKSAVENKKKTFDGNYFSNITPSSGIDFVHKTSSWLNRLLRSYLPEGSGVVTITIPPAFGGGGVAAGDINNDGQQDILILGGAGNKLYLNNKGHFTDITQSSGIANWTRKDDNMPGEPRQPLIADLDNDGLQDIVIIYVNNKHRVYKNLGNNKFKDMTLTSLLGGDNLVAGPATVFDYDNDGQLDIFITYFGDYLNGVLPTLKRRNTNALPDKLFRNVGGFKFVEVSKGSGLENLGWGQAVTHTDLNADGWQDVIVGNDFGVNSYYINQKNGQFIDVAADIGTGKPSYTMNIGLTDLNDDEQPDIYISNIVTMNKDQKYVLPNENTRMEFNPEKLAQMRVVEANDLFMSVPTNDHTMPKYKASLSVGRGYSSTGWSWGADFFDFDNDSDDDLYVLNGMNEFNIYSSKNPYYTDPLTNKKIDIIIPASFKETNVFFANEAGGLQNQSKLSGLDLLSNSRSAVYLDYDQDGDLDIVMNNYHEAAVVYQNNSEKFGNNWLKIKLVGSPKNKVNLDAIGARMIVTTSAGEKVWREINGSIGYMSVHPKTKHFGVGASEQVDIKIIWPNGKVQYKYKVKVNQQITVLYPSDS